MDTSFVSSQSVRTNPSGESGAKRRQIFMKCEQSLQESLSTISPADEELSKRQVNSRISRFRLDHVSQSVAIITYGDVCKETCKTPAPPNTCKLECHSGAPFTDMQEDIPEAVCQGN